LIFAAYRAALTRFSVDSFPELLIKRISGVLEIYEVQ
jgi:hypothetical protein